MDVSKVPWFPEYEVQVSDSDSKSFVTNSVLLRITTRVPHEQLEDVIRTLLPHQPLPAGMKEIVSGRS
ncbi:hypothetical protein SEA_KALNOKY_46 [Mycobacterium phage Kalnoky]|uniref:Uncharacterized protein n=1 Tax=Mycobacterium phage PurpleHaze TaxID=1983577 RepID=A0A220NRV4_9CAUD|nr:hypothetical protein KIJ57_gp48 [Mycobacterium phage Purple Haze]AVJ50788.1 hypothetical protein SEA_OLANP_44 [Mycobacterium phage OlanP]AXC35151.1 hypothetical protein SEA_PHRANNY_46 [Mycobacterium phage Phranny]AXH44092.1 hypothetical protein SEA_KALNOKY_46 [Mycobacterium phage Kalnoky]AXH44500.1 hypothetical protein SEA_MARIUS_46 [Mycobacterium phage Marius]AXH44671.1 hypothetical protein SEA_PHISHRPHRIENDS_43 [Mycobacterium phage PhishRPhriends]AXH44821.1 hypothetical protein SEA_REBA_